MPESYRGREPYAFASYSHKDGAEIWAEIARLKDAGYRIWYDEGIEPAAEWPEEIARALDGASIFLCFLTPGAAASRHVSDEIHYALERHKEVLMIHWTPAELSAGLSLQLSRRQALVRDVPDESVYRERLNRILDRCGCREGCVAPEKEPAAPNKRARKSGINPWLAVSGVVLLLAMAGWFFRERTSNESRTPAELLIPTALSQPGPAGEVSMAAELEVQFGGVATTAFRPIRPGESLSARDPYRVTVGLKNPAFIYLFQRDSQGKLAWLHPRNDATNFSSGDNPVLADRPHLFPGGDLSYQLDASPGVEYLYVVATSSAWSDLEHLLAEAAREGAVLPAPPDSLATRGVQGVVATPSSGDDRVSDWLRSKDGVVVKSWKFQHVP